ncbi:MAG TPA: hydrogenase maturation nickel metallochaperone HypA [Capsulimonadaceae bacterium]|jgi:hydrogenase nickel incorporation protein HypA/HybF
MPHEVDMTKALMMSLKEWHKTQPQDRVVRVVRLVVGGFTCVEPDLLRSAFSRQKIGTFLENAKLVIRESPFIAYCEPCGKEYRPDIVMEYACPDCRAPMQEIRSGRELKIEGVEMDDGELAQAA